MTEEQLARRLERPQSFVAKYEGSERRIDVVEFVAIARALKRDPREVLDELMRLANDGRPLGGAARER